jgi:hypothetical protein
MTLTDIVVEHPFCSGNFCEVAEVAIVDYGGNQYWHGTAKEYVAKTPKFNIKTKLIATKLGTIRNNAYSNIIATYFQEMEIL